MKKIILTLAAMVGVAGYTYGQGQVGMGTSSAAVTQISTNSGSVGKILGAGGAWTFGLFVANNSSVTSVGGVSSTLSRNDVTPWTDPNWTFTGITGTNTGAAGRFLAANDATGAYVIVPGTTVGNSYNFILVGWNTSAGGNSLNSLMAAYNNPASGLIYGASGIAVGVVMGNNGNPANVALIGSGGASQTLGWSLSPVAVPEPATFALAGLGAAAMLIFRRRK